jgi:hypothetical protein
MTTELKARLIKDALRDGKRCMLHFKSTTKAPMFGFPVHDEAMFAKGFVRFVPEGKIMILRAGANLDMVSKLITLDSVFVVKIVDRCVDDIELQHEKQGRNSSNA